MARQPDELVIVADRLDGPVSAILVGRLEAEHASGYHTITALEPDDFVPPQGAFLLAYLKGQPAGCGGLRTLRPGIGELKRMYVAPWARGQGIGRALLDALEKTARENARSVLRLTSGIRQLAALKLYERAGYRRIPCYGESSKDPLCVCFEKSVSAPVELSPPSVGPHDAG
jgi:GNAT superfamily N-acetyltransferase